MASAINVNNRKYKMSILINGANVINGGGVSARGVAMAKIVMASSAAMAATQCENSMAG
jgi:hypothetical protein